MLMAEPEKSFTDYLKSYVTNNPVYGLTGPNSLQERQEAQFDLFGNRPEPIKDPTTGEMVIQATKTLPSLATDIAAGTLEVIKDPTLVVDAAKTAVDIIWNPNDNEFLAAVKSRLLRRTGNFDHVFKPNPETGVLENDVNRIEKPLDDFIASKKEQYGENWKEIFANNPELFIFDAANISGVGAGVRTTLTNLIPDAKTLTTILDNATPNQLVPAMATVSNKRTPENQQTENLMPTTRAMFGGANALTPITRGPFSKAEQMSAKGAKPQETWKKTGWWLDDVDGKWRFEIDDSEATLPAAMIKTDADGEYLMDTDVGYNDSWSDPDSIFFDKDGPKPLAYDDEYQGEFHGPGSSVWKLGDLLKHNKLFENYPELKSHIVVLNAQFDKPETLGSYDPITGTHKISEQVSDPDAIMSTLLHEIQHAIQSREGFAPGTNQGMAFDFNVKEFQKQRAKVYESLEGQYGENYFFAIPANNTIGENLVVSFETTLKNLNVTLPVDVKADAIKKLKKIQNERITFLKQNKDASREFYFNESGEIESRLTQLRQYLNPAMRKERSPITQKTNVIRDSPIAKKRFSWPYSKTTAQSNFEVDPTYAAMDKQLVKRPNVTDIILKINPEYDTNAFKGLGGWIYKNKEFKDYEEVLDLSVREFLNRTKETKKVSEIKSGDIFTDSTGEEFVFRSFRRVTTGTSDLNPIQPQVLLDNIDPEISNPLGINTSSVEVIGANVIRLDDLTKSQRLDAIEYAKGSMYDDAPSTIGTDNNSIVTLGSMVFNSSLSKLQPTKTAGLRQFNKTKPLNFLTRAKNKLGFAEGGLNTKTTTPVDTGEKTISGRTIWNDPETGEDYSERSTTFEIDGKYYTMPTVSKDGRQHSDDQIRDYVKEHGPVDYLTGEKLPEFRYMEDALEYAKSRSSTRKQTAAGMSEGGSMARQMKMFEEGGIADDGMSRDPVSGNEIPSGSLAEEVRDDIPAQLSEGEYVVPADVVRYFGVRVFEDMRMEAKMGLQKMEQDGRIGGEPIDTPAVRSNTDDLSPEEQQLLQEIMAMEQPQKQPAGFAPGGYAGTIGGSYIGSDYATPKGFKSFADYVISPTEPKDQFKTLGGSYIADGTTGTTGTAGGVTTVDPVVNKVCPPGQIFSEKSQMCIISPDTYKNNDDDGGKTVIPEPEDWGADIDWTNSEGMLGYVSSVLTPMDTALEKGLQIGGAALGGFGGILLAGLPVADAMNDLSNARATSLIARAMGDTKTADAIDAQIDVYVKKAPAIATSWLGNWLSSGTSRAGYLARKAGFDSLEDAAKNPEAFRTALGGTTDAAKKKVIPQSQTETQAIIDKSAGLTLLQAKQRIEAKPFQDQINIIKSSDKGDERYEKALKKATKIASEKKKAADKEQDKIQKAIDSGSIKKELAPTRNQSGEFGMKKGGLIARPKKKTKKKK